MRLELTQRLQQKLAPQLIQSLKMLQMPILKLEQLLRHELAVNPLLEEVESQEQEQELDILADKKDDSREEEKIDWEDYLRDNEDYNAREFKGGDNEEMPEFNVAGEQSLYEHLLEQLAFLKLPTEDFEIGEIIIGNIDESGYLTTTIEEIAETLKIDPERVERILVKIHRFDPSGVGARDLKESLLLQLRDRHCDNNLVYRIVEEHLETLDKKSFQQLAKSMGVSLERVQEAMEVIKSLSPRPAYGRFARAAAAVIPDLIVEKIGEEWVISHNDRNVPQLRVNAGYRELLKRGNNTPQETKKYVREKLEQARWLLNAINQRRNTMIRVMTAIVQEQLDFFENGIEHLKPLTMEDIANIVNMNVATISRVSSDKYVQTPHGVFEIKFFFNSGVKTQDGEEVAKRTVKQQIEEIIAKEDPGKPLSDQEIFEILNQRDIRIARRTVTKYREEMKILPARFRRRAV
ncbi:MAG: RNA polymerase factor sigma-54 [candidate division Zixibacteria bacterium]|nr:RNA polymerase factor sigma-54 [candidate division Zixibacteria bacterium]